jgi:DnaK suppressor protein
LPRRIGAGEMPGADPRGGKTNQAMLTSEAIERFKNELEQQLDELLARAEITVKILSTDDNTASDPLDQATLDSGRVHTLRFRERESRLIRKIKTTLLKIEEGEFGICEACGGDIPFKRLSARPVTAYCIGCKTAMEARERAVGL